MSYAKLKSPVRDCDLLEYVSGGAVTAGTMSVLGQTLVYNLSGATASGQTVKGVYRAPKLELKKQAALAINAGDEVWWDTGALEVDKTNTNANLGFCVRTAAAGDAVVLVSLQNMNVG